MKFFAAILTIISLTASSVALQTSFQASSIRVAPSKYRRIASVDFTGRDFYDLAHKVGMYQRKGTESLPGAEIGAFALGWQTWHGSNGLGLVAYAPQSGRYTIYFSHEQAIPGHMVFIVYADKDLILFCYGYRSGTYDITAAFEAYSIKNDRFAVIEAISSREAKLGYFSFEALKTKRPVSMGPASTWDYRRYKGKEWIPITESGLFFPSNVELKDGVFTLSYHTSWDIEQFVTLLKFSKSDLVKEFEKIKVGPL